MACIDCRRTDVLVVFVVNCTCKGEHLVAVRELLLSAVVFLLLIVVPNIAEICDCVVCINAEDLEDCLGDTLCHFNLNTIGSKECHNRKGYLLSCAAALFVIAAHKCVRNSRAADVVDLDVDVAHDEVEDEFIEVNIR